MSDNADDFMDWDGIFDPIFWPPKEVWSDSWAFAAEAANEIWPPEEGGEG